MYMITQYAAVNYGSIMLQSLSPAHSTRKRIRISNGRNTYVLVGLLGNGGFGAVYKCYDEATCFRYAIKIGFPNSNIENECNVLSTVQSDNIVKMHDFGRNWIVMELCDYDLRQMLQVNISLDEHTIRGLFKQVAAAFDVIHKNGLIHGDMKPDNILLSGGFVKIADFGCAKIFSANSCCGTCAYMAPEMFHPSYCGGGTEIDLWSIGVTMYECFFGVRPIQGLAYSTFKNFFNENPLWTPPIPTNGLQPSPFLEQLLCKLLKINSTERMSLEEFKCDPFFNDAVVSYNVPLPVYNQIQPQVSNRHPHSVVPGFTPA